MPGGAAFPRNPDGMSLFREGPPYVTLPAPGRVYLDRALEIPGPRSRSRVRYDRLPTLAGSNRVLPQRSCWLLPTGWEDAGHNDHPGHGHNPSNGQAWWMPLQPWFSHPAPAPAGSRRPAGPATDRNAPGQAGDTGIQPPSRHAASWIYSASCTAEEDRGVHEARREAGGHRVDWVRHDGHLYTFSHPDESSASTSITTTLTGRTGP